MCRRCCPRGNSGRDQAKKLGELPAARRRAVSTVEQGNNFDPAPTQEEARRTGQGHLGGRAAGKYRRHVTAAGRCVYTRFRRENHPASAPSTSPASGASGTSVVTLTRMPSAKPITAPTTIAAAMLILIAARLPALRRLGGCARDSTSEPAFAPPGRASSLAGALSSRPDTKGSRGTSPSADVTGGRARFAPLAGAAG